MATYKRDDDAHRVMIPGALESQRMPGTLELARHELVQRRLDPSIFDRISRHDETGCPADDPKIVLKVSLVASARGRMSSRKIEQACRDHITCMALACGMLPDHRTIAAVVSSRNEEITAICRDLLLLCAEPQL
jgi:transposase